jgi:hypothetical protein
MAVTPPTKLVPEDLEDFWMMDMRDAAVLVALEVAGGTEFQLAQGKPMSLLEEKVALMDSLIRRATMIKEDLEAAY